MPEFVEQPIYHQLARIGKALSSPIRLRLLDLLDVRERTVEELSAQAGIPLKNTSAQLQQLRATHLVATRKEGTRVYYRLADPEVRRFLGTLQGFAESRLADLRQVIDAHLGTDADITPVTVDELAARLADENICVLDVRSAAEYEQGHIPGAISVPADDIGGWLDRFPSSVDIVAYCSGPYCVASPRVAQFLHEHGHRARPLDGGFTRWQRARAEQGTA